MPDDILFAKAAVIERALRRVLEIYKNDPSLQDLMHLDALTLNVERACQAAINLAMHLVAIKHLGMPQSQADAFRLLANANYISPDLADRMTGMCGFRNILIHQYQEIEIQLLHNIARTHWQDIVELCTSCGIEIHVP